MENSHLIFINNASWCGRFDAAVFRRRFWVKVDVTAGVTRAVGNTARSSRAPLKRTPLRSIIMPLPANCFVEWWLLPHHLISFLRLYLNNCCTRISKQHCFCEHHLKFFMLCCSPLHLENPLSLLSILTSFPSSESSYLSLISFIPQVDRWMISGYKQYYNSKVCFRYSDWKKNNRPQGHKLCEIMFHNRKNVTSDYILLGQHNTIILCCVLMEVFRSELSVQSKT